MVVVSALTGTVPAAEGRAPTVRGQLAENGVASGPAARVVAAAKAAPSKPPVGSTGSHELVALRTITSNTYVDGRSRRVRIYNEPVNYRDEDGAFQPISDQLVATDEADYAVRNEAGPYDAQLPADLADAPVSLALGTGENAPVVEMTIEHATADADVAGNTATYDDAVPGVTVQYEAQPDGLKESLLLTSRESPTTITETLALPAGYTLDAAGQGGWAIRSATGRLVGMLPPFTVVDAAGTPGVVRTEVTTSPGANGGTDYELALSVPTAWASAPDRVFPINIDPTITLPIQTNTYIEGGSHATTNYGSGSSLYAGYNSSIGAAAHTLLGFDVTSSIPLDATVLSTTLGVYVSSNSATSANLQLYGATKNWTQAGATWNKYNATSSWTTPGGDYAGDAQLSGQPYSTTTATGAGSYVYFAPTKLVAKWLTGEVAQNGFLIKTASDTSGPLVGFKNNTAPSGQGPFLDVTYQESAGFASDQTLDEHQLGDHLKVSINVGSNDATVSATDAQITGVGQPLRIGRTYSENHTLAATGDLASGWTLDPGPDTSLGLFPDTKVYYDPDGGAHVFSPNGSGGWITPPATNATLTHPSANWKLYFHQTQITETFNAAGQLISRADKNGNTITLNYAAGTPSHRLTSITDTIGRTTTFTYANGYNLSQITDPAGRTTTYGYDATNTYLTSVTDSNGGVTTYGYASPYGYLNKITTPNGRQTLLTPASRSMTLTRVTNVAAQTGPTTTYAFSGLSTVGGNVTDTVTDPNGHRTTYTISPVRSRVTSVSDANGHARATTYTSNGDVSSLADAMSSPNVENRTYDANQNLTKITSPTTTGGGTGSSRSFTYTDTAHPYQATSTTDGQGNNTTYSYNTAGNATQVQNSLAIQTAAYQGDPGTTCGAKPGQLCSTTDANSHVTTYAYNANGQLTTVTPPSPLGTTQYTYDSLSRVATMTDGKGQVTRYTYDGLDRITQTLTGGAATCILSSGNCVQQTYDGDGNTLTRTDVTGTTSWSYDLLGRLTSKTLPGSVSSSVTYDDAGNILTNTDSGGTVTYGYDNANNLTKLAEPGGSCTGATSRCTTFTYDNNDRRTQITYPSGQTVKLTYDNGGRQTKIAAHRPGASTPFVSRTYSYTKASNDTSLRQSVTDQGGVTTTYTYDALNRLTAANASTGPNYSYTYDAAGNITAGSLGTRTYNNANETSSTGYTFDANGNQTATPGGLSAAYNTNNQTSSFTVGSTTTGQTYLGSGQTERATSGSATLSNNLLGLGQRTISEASVYFTRDPDGNLISMRQGTATSYTSSYYTLDAIGSVLKLTDATGNTDVATYTYDPYGTSLTATGTLATTNPYRFQNGYYDNATSLYLYGERYYQPTQGRWTQTDSLRHLGDLNQANLYSFVSGDPVNNTDPTGRQTGKETGDYCSSSFGCANGKQYDGPWVKGDNDCGESLFFLAVTPLAGPVGLGGLLLGGAGAAVGCG